MPTHRSSSSSQPTLRHPSWWIVVIASCLVIIFLVAIVRELVNGWKVRQQVQRLQRSVVAEQQHLAQLQDLIDYLASPTFQEREARLKLGLKKDGERVIVVSPATNLNNQTVDGQTGQVTGPPTTPQRWWRYFFGDKKST